MNHKVKILLGFIVIYFVWGSTYLAIKYAVETLPPFTMMGVRFGIAGLMLYGWLCFKGHGRVSRSEWVSSTILALTMIAFGTGVVAWVEEYIASGLTALLLSVSPIWMVLLEALQPGGRKPGVRGLAGILAGLVGVLMLIGPGNLGNNLPLLPVGILLLSSISWAFGSIYARHNKSGGTPLKTTSLQMMIGGLILLIMGMARGEAGSLAVATVSFSSVASLIYLIVFGGLLVFPIYVWLMKQVDPGLVGTHAYVNPVVALILGWLFADEVLDMTVLGATVLILFSIVMLSLDNKHARFRKNRTEQCSAVRKMALE